jgi:solute carrier family 35 protein F1/2
MISAVLDTQANFFVVMAYEYASIVTVFILSNSTVITVMILSIVFLKARYTWLQYLGTVIALAGIVLVVISDITGFDSTELGVIYVFISVILYSCCNVW